MYLISWKRRVSFRAMLNWTRTSFINIAIRQIIYWSEYTRRDTLYIDVLRKSCINITSTRQSLNVRVLTTNVKLQTNCYILCYSVEDHVSLANISNVWIKELRSHSPKTPIILVGKNNYWWRVILCFYILCACVWMCGCSGKSLIIIRYFKHILFF